MTEISEAAWRRARELACANGMPDDGITPNGPYTGPLLQAFARFIREVSDAAKNLASLCGPSGQAALQLAPFILPDPVDPLLIEARKIALEYGLPGCLHNLTSERTDAGEADDLAAIQSVLDALRRGMELAKASGVEG